MRHIHIVKLCVSCSSNSGHIGVLCVKVKHPDAFTTVFTVGVCTLAAHGEGERNNSIYGCVYLFFLALSKLCTTACVSVRLVRGRCYSLYFFTGKTSFFVSFFLGGKTMFLPFLLTYFPSFLILRLYLSLCTQTVYICVVMCACLRTEYVSPSASVNKHA
eukprot:GHVS01025196.1.p1 GENE.GHVS01025196.1~~GHVS01025196.1.p1  ORF type:complete len:160 (+),score=9.29 GHVS01025196.1:149-628(+)